MSISCNEMNQYLIGDHVGMQCVNRISTILQKIDLIKRCAVLCYVALYIDIASFPGSSLCTQ